MSTAPAPLSPGGFDQLYGLELIEVGEELARGRVAIRDELKQASGDVHGGVYVAIAQSLASIATAEAFASDRKLSALLSNQTSFLRPISEGAIHAAAVMKHRGRTTWVWEVELTDDQGMLCALTRITIALKDDAGAKPASPAPRIEWSLRGSASEERRQLSRARRSTRAADRRARRCPRARRSPRTGQSSAARCSS